MARILGIDVSSVQGKNIDYVKAKAFGVQFVYIKATEGPAFKDPCFDINWKNALNAGVLRGAYCFLHIERDPIATAEFFYKTVGDLGDSDLPPAADFEVNHGKTQKECIAWLEAFTARAEELFKRRIIIYTGFYFWNLYGDRNSKWAEKPLWVAAYGTSAPKVPLPWTKWKIWQYSGNDSKPVDGVPAVVDHDWFDDSEGDLNAFIAASIISPPVQAAAVQTTVEASNNAPQEANPPQPEAAESAQNQSSDQAQQIVQADANKQSILDIIMQIIQFIWGLIQKMQGTKK